MRRFMTAVCIAAAAGLEAPNIRAEAIKARSDAEILALVIALDENEVQAASAAEKKKVDGRVLELAETIHQDHAKNLKETKALGAKIGITPAATPAVARLRAKGKEALAKLTPLSGGTFTNAFVTAMVEGHREALLMLDEFLNTAQNEELKTQLSTARQHIAMHLQKAEDLKMANGAKDAN